MGWDKEKREEFDEYRSTVRFDLTWSDQYGFERSAEWIKSEYTNNDTERESIIQALRALADEIESWGE
jgi:ribonuclease HI